jgi:xanthine dehydrogenase accessory factor
LLDVDTHEDLEKLADSAGGRSRLPQVDVESTAGIPAGQPELVVVGRDAVAVALAKLSRVMGFTTTIVDPFLSVDEIPEAGRILHVLDFSRLPTTPRRAVVVASRGQFDEDALEQAMQADSTYIGLLANKKRSQDLEATLRRKGVSPERIARMRAPAGLEIGAESPEEIALSILAEIVAEQHR